MLQQSHRLQAATLKAVKERMRSVSSIGKITKAMKMVAAAKLRHDQLRMEKGKPFAVPSVALFSKLGEAQADGQTTPLTIVALTSDKGLCGGVNSAVVKLARVTTLEEEAKGAAVNIVCVGNKSAAGLKRLVGDRITHLFEEATRTPWSFSNASIIASRLSAANPARLWVAGNRFRSMISYETEITKLVTRHQCDRMDKGIWSKLIDQYSFEPSVFEVIDDLHEFYLASAIYGGFLEGITSEQSARMNAMDNASKNAGEMFTSLELLYNRARQTKITTELCEIISGASAV